ncbi:Zinc finger PHD-finger [Arabidopsis suecica]|uniref:Zinc finger PHD-finger n=1 Tax=Arabidopsis suecica TaxID=45249 RepID=A0A8T2F7T3_ARASU|nr:Zinc finger PHD-finger [Arabidopsis suecica]
MDIATSNAPMNLESVAMVDGNGAEPVSPPAKKPRFDEEMNRVAEIVLVLSALGRMRGGETPTALELELMFEARSKLAGMCLEFDPKDIIRKDDVKSVIEDLGFNGKLKDQRLGFRAPTVTISEKLSLGKRKMEEAEKYPTTSTVSTGYTLSQPNGSLASPGGLANKASVAHQWPSSEVATANTSGSHSKLDRPQMVLNGASQGTPVSSANYYAEPWSAQLPSTISFSTAPDKKVPIQSSVRTADPSFRPFRHGTFTGTNQPMHYSQTSSFGGNHTEIAKIIHKFLQPRVKQYPLWNPPSREYMSRAMACQICEVTINEMDTLLICDACEKAYHLKCLQGNNMKGVPKSEWHCSRCVQAFNGKPFPPTYGRATRAVATTTAKMPFRAAGVLSSSAKKIGPMDIKVNQQKPIVSTFSRLQNTGLVSGAATTSQFESASVNAKTTASAAKTTNIGSQGSKENVACGANSPAPVSLTETPNRTGIASTISVINNGLISKPLTPVGTMSSTSPLPVVNQLPVNATSNASPSTPITASLVAQAPTVTQNGDGSSTASGTADHSILNADITTQVHTLTVTSSSNSQQAVSHSEVAKATEDAAPLENVSECEKPSESTSHPDSLNDKTISENVQESSKDAKVDSEACQNHPTASPATVVPDQDSTITAAPSVTQEDSAFNTEKTPPQPLSVSSNYDSQTEKETPNVQDSVHNVPGDSEKGKGLNGLDDRHQEQPSEPEFYKSDSVKEENAA